MVCRTPKDRWLDSDRSLAFDRRRSPRHPAHGSYLAIFSDGNGRFGLAPVAAFDASRGGLGVTCPIRIDAGVRLSLTPSANPLPDNCATVVRCDTDGEGYRLGLRFDRELRSAA